MNESAVRNSIAQTFLDMACALETGRCARRPCIALAGIESEHGEAQVLRAAKQAAKCGAEVLYIGTLQDDEVETVYAENADEAHRKMQKLLETGRADGAVTMHYPFPIGTATVGRVVTPARGKEMFLATTTGAASADRVQAMVRNAVSGIIAAKACGVEQPTVGILNVEGARKAESALRRLAANGYPITFAESARADGGCVMRGNDLLAGSCDVMVTDSLTGNLLMKMLSAFTTGGSYEAVGSGYGPGIGGGQKELVLIVSRASGAPVIANAVLYAAQLVQNDYRAVEKAQLAAANAAGLCEILESCRPAPAAEKPKAAAAPPKEVVTCAFAGIDVMDLEDAVQCLWAQGVYAESGMGCTGPVVLVSEANRERAKALLTAGGWLG